MRVQDRLDLRVVEDEGTKQTMLSEFAFLIGNAVSAFYPNLITPPVEQPVAVVFYENQKRFEYDLVTARDPGSFLTDFILEKVDLKLVSSIDVTVDAYDNNLSMTMLCNGVSHLKLNVVPYKLREKLAYTEQELAAEQEAANEQYGDEDMPF